MNIEFQLPLPPSKNKRRAMIRLTGGGAVPTVSSAVKIYRHRVAMELLSYRGKLKDGVKIVFDCVWRKKNGNQDSSNFHDELLDAVCPALGINDKWVLIRDQDFTVEPRNPGVTVTAWELTAIKNQGGR